MDKNTVKNIIKTSTVGTAAASIIATAPMAFAAGTALDGANQWKPEEMVGEGGTMGGMNINNDTISAGVRSIASFILGIAIILFVLRMVLTAVDRMVFANLGMNARVPFSYPNPGDERWDDDERQTGGEGWTWKKIFINFAKNVGIAAGAWVIVNLITGLVSYFFASGLTNGTGQ